MKPSRGPDQTITQLLERSHRLGSDPRNTNFAGGNTSAKGEALDPVAGQLVEVMWVKGSGSDLGTLTEDGLAILRVDRLRALVEGYPGVEREDEMVAAFDFCLHGKGGAPPSIDTAMHGLVRRVHVDHLHPDAGIALATAENGEELTHECFGERVAWLPWRRPGFQLGLEIAAIERDRPDAIGVVLGGHGITAWGQDSETCERNSLAIIKEATEFIQRRGKTDPLGAALPERLPRSDPERHSRAALLFPYLRRLASTDYRQVGHFDDTPLVLDFLSRSRMDEVARRGTSCPDHFIRTKIRPLIVDLTPDAPLASVRERVAALHQKYREEYRSYYERWADPTSPPMRGADPAIVLVPGIGMFSFGKTKQAARLASEFYINAINVMTGAEALSVYKPIDESEKFRVEYWELEEQKLRRLPPPRPLETRIALVTGAGSGIGRATATRLAREGASVIVTDVNGASAEETADGIGSSDAAVACELDVSQEDDIVSALRSAILEFGGIDIVVNNAGMSISKDLLETTVEDWDIQHRVMARGSFLVAREAARVMIDQGLGGDIVYVVSKNAVAAGPNNLAYGAAKADQAHQVRLLAAELGGYGIRVNGVNPDAVVRGSGIFAAGWGAERAAIYGVAEEELGRYYASRSLLGLEVLPEHVAAAIYALVGGDLSLTTGLHVPVDSGVPAAFLR